MLNETYADVIRRRLEVPLSEGPDKVTTLEEALRRLVKPGMTLHLGTAHARANVPVPGLVRPGGAEPHGGDREGRLLSPPLADELADVDVSARMGRPEVEH